MSKKRFTIHKESKYKEEWYAYPFCIKEDGEVFLETIPLSIAEKVRDKLNEQDKEIGLLRLELDTHKHPLWSTREAERKLNKLADSLADEIKKNGLLNEEINQLRIENMRLKKKVE